MLNFFRSLVINNEIIGMINVDKISIKIGMPEFIHYLKYIILKN
jgi:hypothetical protein